MLFFRNSTRGFLVPLTQWVQELCICPGCTSLRPRVHSRGPGGGALSDLGAHGVAGRHHRRPAPTGMDDVLPVLGHRLSKAALAAAFTPCVQTPVSPKSLCPPLLFAPSPEMQG